MVFDPNHSFIGRVVVVSTTLRGSPWLTLKYHGEAINNDHRRGEGIDLK